MDLSGWLPQFSHTGIEHLSTNGQEKACTEVVSHLLSQSNAKDGEVLHGRGLDENKREACKYQREWPCRQLFAYWDKQQKVLQHQSHAHKTCELGRSRLPFQASKLI